MSQALGLRDGQIGEFALNSLNWRNAAALAILLLCLTQMFGDLLGNRVLRGLGAASAMAPCPKVFCDVNGLEGFASKFTLQLETNSGRVRDLEITPEIYARLKGPYNRRNAYGAAMSFAPKLPPDLWQSVYNYGWRENGPLRAELGVPNDTRSIATVIRTQTRGRNEVWTLQLRRAR